MMDWTKVAAGDAQSLASDLRAGVGNIEQRLSRMEQRLDRIWSEIEFISRRQYHYLGQNVGLTHLQNDLKIFINTDDFVSPINFIEGGKYEVDNLEVLMSYLTPRSVFLDIGANLGVYSLLIGDRIRDVGKVLAFEPQPRMVDLFGRSLFQNTLTNTVQILPFGLSDVAGEFDIWLPHDSPGGASFTPPLDQSGKTHSRLSARVYALDELMAPDFTCDLVKIDVEGHELRVLTGMKDVLGRSKDAKVLFEKLAPASGLEQGLMSYFQALGFNIFAVEPGARLRLLDLEQFIAFSGYVLAGRPQAVGDLDRNHFRIYPDQIRSALARGRGDSGAVYEGVGNLTLGPYWHLPSGKWTVELEGKIEGEVQAAITERFGRWVTPITFGAGNAVFIDRDLNQFELVIYSTGAPARLELKAIKFSRET